MSLLIYGAYGYTGELVAETAVDRGLDVIVAGRDEDKTRRVAGNLDCDSRSFGLDAVPRNVDDVDAVLNCAGPFVQTAQPIVDACLRTETHYLDITGEIPVFETLETHDQAAREAGICILPGVGFDVVPTDCLAAHLHDRLPGATDLWLGIDPTGSVSRGTLATAIEHVDSGGTIRRDGDLETVPVAHDRRDIDFGRGTRPAVTIPMGDVSTAYRTTGIENISVYLALPRRMQLVLGLSRHITGLFGFEPIKRSLQWLIGAIFSGPSAKQREAGNCYVWGRATDGEQTVTSRLRTPETYALTVDAATTAAVRVLDSAPVGYYTPAGAFSSEFVLNLDGVSGFYDSEETDHNWE